MLRDDLLGIEYLPRGKLISAHLAWPADLLEVHMADMNTLTPRERFVPDRIVWINKYFHQ